MCVLPSPVPLSNPPPPDLPSPACWRPRAQGAERGRAGARPRHRHHCRRRRVPGRGRRSCRVGVEAEPRAGAADRRRPADGLARCPAWHNRCRLCRDRGAPREYPSRSCAPRICARVRLTAGAATAQAGAHMVNGPSDANVVAAGCVAGTLPGLRASNLGAAFAGCLLFGGAQALGADLPSSTYPPALPRLPARQVRALNAPDPLRCLQVL